MQLVILAGGKGTRLSLTDIPKPMVQIAGKPLLEHQIELAKRYGINEIFILSGFLSDQIVNYFGNGSSWNVKIHHIIDIKPLGTAGAIKQLEDIIKERFMVIYGDIILDINLKAFIEYDKQDPETIGTIIVHPNDHPYDSDLVNIDLYNYVTSFSPKPHMSDDLYNNCVNAAVYIFSPQIFGYIEKDVFLDFGKDLFPLLIKQNKKIKSYTSSEYIKDMGTKNRLKKVTQDWFSGKIQRLNKENKRKAIFLDRDGVINKNMDKNISIKNFILLPKVPEAINIINNSDYLCIIVTNQPMIAKGFITFEDLDKIHKKMVTLVGKENAYFDRIYFCPHHPENGFIGEIPELKIECSCRKPNPGMLLKAAEDYNIDLINSWIIGDSFIDIIAGKSVKCKTIIVGGKSCSESDYQKNDLLEAVNFIFEQNNI